MIIVDAVTLKACYKSHSSGGNPDITRLVSDPGLAKRERKTPVTPIRAAKDEVVGQMTAKLRARGRNETNRHFGSGLFP
jgi:hypothetical protein